MTARSAWKVLRHDTPFLVEKRDLVKEMREAKLTIVRRVSTHEIFKLARRGHGGNYQGFDWNATGDTMGDFQWSNAKARATIRHNLTNHDQLWKKINKVGIGDPAYEMLRRRIDALVDEAYPRFAEGHPQVYHRWG